MPLYNNPIAASQLPALTGDVTSSAGSAATTAAATQANIATLSKAAGCAVHGTNTNDAAAAGYVGEYIEGLVSTPTNFGTSGQYSDPTSISLTAGDWDVSALVGATSKAAVGLSATYMGISTTSGNSTTGLVAGSNWLLTDYAAPLANTAQAGHDVPCYRMSLSGTTTVYLKLRMDWATTAPQYTCRLSARRVR